MATTQPQRLGIFFALALVMAATRIHHSFLHHFDAVPDASWGVFFLAGFWLRGSARWAFPLLMAEAVLIDYAVITNQGLDFWSHYCVSTAYWFLIPSYFSLWLGGSLLAKHAHGLRLSSVAMGAAAVLVDAPDRRAAHVERSGAPQGRVPRGPAPDRAAAWMSSGRTLTVSSSTGRCWTSGLCSISCTGTCGWGLWNCERGSGLAVSKA